MLALTTISFQKTANNTLEAYKFMYVHANTLQIENQITMMCPNLGIVVSHLGHTCAQDGTVWVTSLKIFCQKLASSR